MGGSTVGLEPEAEAGGDEGAQTSQDDEHLGIGEIGGERELQRRPVEACGIERVRIEVPGGGADRSGERAAGGGARGLRNDGLEEQRAGGDTRIELGRARQVQNERWIEGTQGEDLGAHAHGGPRSLSMAWIMW